MNSALLVLKLVQLREGSIALGPPKNIWHKSALNLHF